MRTRRREKFESFTLGSEDEEDGQSNRINAEVSSKCCKVPLGHDGASVRRRGKRREGRETRQSQSEPREKAEIERSSHQR